MHIRELGRADFESPELWRLLWLACETSDAELSHIRDDVLPQLTVVGIGDDGLAGFIAFHPVEGGVEIDYIATEVASQGRGIGRALVGEVVRRYPAEPIIAETDDDAIYFYRKLGFVDSPAARDSRWPERARYRCLLAPGSAIEREMRRMVG